MGQAKNRQAAAGQMVEHINIGTGEPALFKQAGCSYSSFEKHLEHLGSALHAGGGKPDAKVPCAGCATCCYHPRIEVDRVVEPAERLAYLDLVPDELGDMQLRHQENGACVHLGPQGCTVYEHRPTTCRSYDCRIMGFFSVAIDHGNGHSEPAWEFRVASTEDEDIKMSISFLLMQYRMKHPGAFIIPEAAHYIRTRMHQTRRQMRAGLQQQHIDLAA